MFCCWQAQEQSHNQQVAAFNRDSHLMSREVIRAQKIASDAAEGSARAIDKTRQDTTRSLQDSTMSLLAAQSEATKATAEAARQLAEVRDLTISPLYLFFLLNSSLFPGRTFSHYSMYCGKESLLL